MMTVNELIAKLLGYPPNAEVRLIPTPDGGAMLTVGSVIIMEEVGNE